MKTVKLVITMAALSTLFSVYLTGVMPAMAEELSAKAVRKPAVIETKTMSIIATVTAIDQKKRIISLAGKDGASQEIELAESVKNLDQIKVGDEVALNVVESVAVYVEKDAGKKLRRKSYENVNVSLPDKKTMQIRVKVEEMTASVESIDLENRLITLKYPNGAKQTYFVPRTTKNLDKLKTSDQILFRYTKSKGVKMIKNPKAVLQAPSETVVTKEPTPASR
jgi:hypothetical protein